MWLFFQGGATAVETTDMDTRLNFTSALLVNWPNKVCFLFFSFFFYYICWPSKGGQGGRRWKRGVVGGGPGDARETLRWTMNKRN